jgi:hypothetical protein
MIHIHGDTDGLRYFSDKNGICAYNDRVVAYAMQDSDIVGVFYTIQQAQSFYEYNKFKDNLPVLFYWDESRWKNRSRRSEFN